MLLRESQTTIVGFPSFLTVYTFPAHRNSYIDTLDLPTIFQLALSLNTIADAYQASTRLHHVFTAELLEEAAIMGSGSPAIGTNGSRVIDPSMDVSIRVRGGQFTWDGAPPAEVNDKKKGGGKMTTEQKAAKEAKELKEKLHEADEEERIFKLKDIDFEIPKGKVRI